MQKNINEDNEDNLVYVESFFDDIIDSEKQELYEKFCKEGKIEKMVRIIDCVESINHEKQQAFQTEKNNIINEIKTTAFDEIKDTLTDSIDEKLLTSAIRKYIRAKFREKITNLNNEITKCNHLEKDKKNDQEESLQNNDIDKNIKLACKKGLKRIYKLEKSQIDSFYNEIANNNTTYGDLKSMLGLSDEHLTKFFEDVFKKLSKEKKEKITEINPDNILVLNVNHMIKKASPIDQPLKFNKYLYKYFHDHGKFSLLFDTDFQARLTILLKTLSSSTTIAGDVKRAVLEQLVAILPSSFGTAYDENKMVALEQKKTHHKQKTGMLVSMLKYLAIILVCSVIGGIMGALLSKFGVLNLTYIIALKVSFLTQFSVALAASGSVAAMVTNGLLCLLAFGCMAVIGCGLYQLLSYLLKGSSADHDVVKDGQLDEPDSIIPKLLKSGCITNLSTDYKLDEELKSTYYADRLLQEQDDENFKKGFFQFINGFGLNKSKKGFKRIASNSLDGKVLSSRFITFMKYVRTYISQKQYDIDATKKLLLLLAGSTTDDLFRANDKTELSFGYYGQLLQDNAVAPIFKEKVTNAEKSNYNQYIKDINKIN